MRRSFKELKIVKVRKEHECQGCDILISKGERAFVESGFNRSEGFFSSYFHTKEDCYSMYFDAVQPNNSGLIEFKIQDQSFFGQIEFMKGPKEERF